MSFRSSQEQSDSYADVRSSISVVNFEVVGSSRWLDEESTWALHLDSGDSGQVLVIHLRMTGSLRLRDRAFADEPFTRAVFELDGGDQLRFVDVRKFGTIDLVDRFEDALPALGPEPLSEEFTVDALWQGLRGRQQPVKAALLDQRNVAGIGNIYADEALFLAGLNPEAPAGIAATS